MVPHHPRPDPACAERTTDVNVVTFAQLKLAQSPNRYSAFLQATKNDCVGTWLRFQLTGGCMHLTKRLRRRQGSAAIEGGKPRSRLAGALQQLVRQHVLTIMAF
jgi:hypothetical protein